MKIAIICTLYPPYILGGAEISISLLAKGLAKKGNEVIVITTGKEDSVESLDGVTIYRIKNKNIYWRYPQREKSIIRKSLWHLIDIYNPFYKGRVSKILLEFKPDIINTSNLCGISTMVWNVASKLNIPIVHTLRDYYLLCPQQTMIKGTRSCEEQCMVCKTYSFVKKNMSQKVDALIGISDFIRKKHQKNGYFQNVKLVRTIPNSVESFSSNVSRKKKMCIGYIGRLSPEKGIEFMLDAFLKSDISKTQRFIIAGTGNVDYEKKLKATFNMDNIVFVGHMKPVQFFEKIDLLIVPSLWEEPFGRVVIESYNSHCPVFMSDNGGLKELQVDGISWCFDTRNENRLLSLLNDFSSNKLVVDESIFEKEILKYSEQRITDSYMDVFNELLKNK